MVPQHVQSCIDACVQCAQACEYCADACLNEPEVKRMAECIRLDRDCAAICWAAAGMMSRGSRSIQAVCSLCADLCEACSTECMQHRYEHCQQCAAACLRCMKECRHMASMTNAMIAMVN